MVRKTEVIEQHTVPENTKPVRLSDYAFKVFKTINSKNGIKKAIKSGRITINDEKSETGIWIKPGQIISLHKTEINNSKPYKLKLEIVFEDEYIAVINKPAGISVSANQFKSIKNALSYNLKPSKEKDKLAEFLPVHRLDNPTSGLLIIAKTSSAVISLGRQFQQKLIKKCYRAVVQGKIQSEGTINLKIDNKNAITKYKTIKTVNSIKSKSLSLIDLFPETGKKHQLRKHLSAIGNPILGDKNYGIEGNIFRGKGLFLCAVELSFTHPYNDKQVSFKINEPQKFIKFMDNEEKRFNKHFV